LKPFIVKVWESLKIATTALSHNKMRSILTTLGIIIGVLTVVSVASIIEGLNKGFESEIAGLGSNRLYISRYPWIWTGNWHELRNRPRITMKEVEYIKEHIKLAEAVSPSAGTRRNIKYRNSSLEDVHLSGVTIESEKIEGFNIKTGRYFTPIEINKNRNMAILGYEIYEQLFGNRNPIGERVRIDNIAYTVIGVMEKRGAILGSNLDTEIYVPIGSIFKNFGFRRNIDIVVKVPDASLVESAKDEAHFLMRMARGLRPGEKDDFSINEQEMLADLYNQLTGVLYTAAIGIGTLSLIVGGIGIMNIMLVSVSERRREIGIRKALGATRSTIMYQFIIESIIICVIGGIIAILFSYLISILIDKVTPFPSAVPLWSILMGLGFSVLVGLFFGIYPAQRAAKLNPIECLRYE
jgi:putative ABC transport system permease protein